MRCLPLLIGVLLLVPTSTAAEIALPHGGATLLVLSPGTRYCVTLDDSHASATVELRERNGTSFVAWRLSPGASQCFVAPRSPISVAASASPRPAFLLLTPDNRSEAGVGLVVPVERSAEDPSTIALAGAIGFLALVARRAGRIGG